jgi:2-polyprenyl-6-methoxyphenol hydroxylase-like FAD-dependent oxidoreductase
MNIWGAGVLGVIGLTTAIKIQERGGYHVTVVAEVFPSDPKSTRYTSHWAVGSFNQMHDIA